MADCVWALFSPAEAAMSPKKSVTPEHPAMIDVPRPLFPLGRVVGTPGAVEALQEIGTDPSELLDRHVKGISVTSARRTWG